MEKKKICAYIINQFLDMPPKAKSKRSPRTPRQRRPRPLATKATVALIKKTIMKTAETKQYMTPVNVVTLLHNTPLIVSTNLTITTTTPSTNQSFVDPRIGDSVQAQGIKFKLLFMTYGDRPNVTFRLWVIKTPAYSPVNGIYPYTYSTWFESRTNQWVLDDINKQNVSVVKQMTFKPPVADSSQESGATLKETSYVRSMYVPLNRVIKYQDEGASTLPTGTHSKGSAYQLLVAAYDTYGTLVTDLAGKLLIQHTFLFKDL